MNEKTWEFSLRAYPMLRPSHCLHRRIDNAASPRRVILFPLRSAGGYNTSDMDVPVAVSSSMSSLRSLSIEDNVRKRPFLRPVDCGGGSSAMSPLGAMIIKKSPRFPLSGWLRMGQKYELFVIQTKESRVFLLFVA